MAIEQDLIQAGLTEKEARVYLAALELGPAAVVALSKKSGVKRTTLYEVLRGLKEKGLVVENIFGKRVRFVAEPPEKFFELKRSEVEALRKVLPTLDALRNVAIEKPMVRFFQGKEAVMQIYEEMVTKASPIHDKILAIEGKVPLNLGKLGEVFWTKLLQRKKERGVESLTLLTHDEKTLEAFIRQFPRGVEHPIEIRLLADPENQFTMNVYMVWNKLIFIATDQLIALVIENERLAKSFGLLFGWLWAQGKETGYRL